MLRVECANFSNIYNILLIFILHNFVFESQFEYFGHTLKHNIRIDAATIKNFL